MATCTAIKPKPYRVCTGDLKFRVVINTRSITPPEADGVDFTEIFSNPITTYAMIETATGETIFDSTNVEKVVTHNFYVRWMPNLTFEEWILFKGKYYDILMCENLNEMDKFILIKACTRGTVALPVNFS